MPAPDGADPHDTLPSQGRRPKRKKPILVLAPHSGGTEDRPVSSAGCHSSLPRQGAGRTDAHLAKGSRASPDRHYTEAMAGTRPRGSAAHGTHVARCRQAGRTDANARCGQVAQTRLSANCRHAITGFPYPSVDRDSPLPMGFAPMACEACPVPGCRRATAIGCGRRLATCLSEGASGCARSSARALEECGGPSRPVSGIHKLFN